MKKVLIVFLFFLCSFNFVKADTLDYWRIHYTSIFNQVEVAAFTILDEERELTLEIIDFNNLNIVFDYLTVEYYNDTPCVECENYIFVENIREQVITKGEAIGTSTPIKISMKSIIEYYQSTKNKYYDFFYIEKNEYAKPKKVFLFRLKLE